MSRSIPLVASACGAALAAAALGLLAPGCGGGSGGGSAPPASTAAPSSASTAPAGSSGAAPITSAGTAPVGTGTGAAPLPRGLAWVRSNPMFISALSVVMPPPTPAQVDAYFDDFDATAVHLWETGLPDRMDGWRAAGRPDLRFVSWVDADGTSRADGRLLGGYPAGVPGRIGYQISDEPRDLAELLAIGRGADAVRARDPDALIILNSIGGSTLSTMLDHAGRHLDVDVFCYDDYDRDDEVYQNMDRAREAGLRHRKPYWRYLNGFLTSDGWATESDMRWDAFAGLTYGFTGHTWFLYQVPAGSPLEPAFFTRQGDYDAPRSPRFAVAAEINRELARLGRAITQLTSTDVRYQAAVPLLQPLRTRRWSPGAGGDPYVTAFVPDGVHDLLIGFFADDAGEVYVMVQNPNHEGGDWPSDDAGAQTIEVHFDFAGAPPALDRARVEHLNKATGQVEPLPLVALGGQRAKLVVTLAAGDPVLFKYATGRPFALR